MLIEKMESILGSSIYSDYPGLLCLYSLARKDLIKLQVEGPPETSRDRICRIWAEFKKTWQVIKFSLLTKSSI